MRSIPKVVLDIYQSARMVVQLLEKIGPMEGTPEHHLLLNMRRTVEEYDKSVAAECAAESVIPEPNGDEL